MTTPTTRELLETLPRTNAAVKNIRTPEIAWTLMWLTKEAAHESSSHEANELGGIINGVGEKQVREVAEKLQSYVDKAWEEAEHNPEGENVKRVAPAAKENVLHLSKEWAERSTYATTAPMWIIPQHFEQLNAKIINELSKTK